MRSEGCERGGSEIRERGREGRGGDSKGGGRCVLEELRG